MACLNQTEVCELELQISSDLGDIIRRLGQGNDDAGHAPLSGPEVLHLNRKAQALKSSAKYLRFLLLSDPTSGKSSMSAEELRMHEQQLGDFDRSIAGLCEQLSEAAREVEEELKQTQAVEAANNNSDGFDAHNVRLANDGQVAAEAATTDSSLPAAGAGPAATANANGSIRNRFPRTNGNATKPSSASSSSTSSSSLHRTRGLLASELERMSSLGDLLNADAASIAQTQAEHEAYTAEIEEARARITKLKQRNAQDHKVILLAFAVLCCVAVYAISGRLLWIVGFKLP